MITRLGTKPAPFMAAFSSKGPNTMTPDITAPGDLNYPSITVINLTSAAAVKHTVKNVGKPGAYKANVTSPAGMGVAVNPDVLALFGFCFDATMLALVYEYMDNGALDAYMFDRCPAIAVPTLRGIANRRRERPSVPPRGVQAQDRPLRCRGLPSCPSTSSSTAA
ncbi:hypothetical protein E2562_015907 [Oryza meyeriana var. granulata]|uniref:Subtilisin-like protease fibronectin type-III domain-containing protein n=1 Tax=Oryza meyeriana var. granulata TaxID=110450 RepID=A0A6G1CGJ1_9ORYZ|nr:hypothetical protein E2562_015907 [Oryza meyeriana var. granulata]